MAIENGTRINQSSQAVVLSPPKKKESKGEGFGRKVLRGAVAVRNDSGLLASTLRAAEHIGKAAEELRGKAAFFTNIQKNVLSANFLDAMPFGSIKYWVKEEWKQDNAPKIAGNVCGTAVSGMCVPFLLQDLEVINLGKIAQSIGKSVRCLNFITKIVAITVLRGLLVGAGLAFGIDAAIRCYDTQKGNFQKDLSGLDDKKKEQWKNYEKKQAMWDVAKNVMSVAFYSAAIFTAASIVTYLGILSYTIGGVGSGLYKHFNKPKEDKQQLIPLKA